MKNFFTFKSHSFLALIAILAVSLFSNSTAFAQTFASPYVVSTFPTTISNINTASGETAAGMQGSCYTIPCCSINVFKVTLPSTGQLRVEMTNFTPLAGSIIAYRSLVANPTSYTDLQFISSSAGNFCGFRDTLQLGRAISGYDWGITPYGQVPTTLTGLTSVYDFNNPSYNSGYFPAGDYYLLVFNENQQVSQGLGLSTDLTFEFAEACAPLTTPTALNFDTLEYNSESDTVSFYVKNQRTLDVDIDTSNISITGTNASEFIFLPVSDTSLAVGDSLQFQVVFSPTSGGTRTASIEIPFSDTSCSTSSSISLNGYGAQPEIVVLGNNISITNNDLSPSSNNFTNLGPVVTNTGSVTRQFQITNAGSDTLTFTNNPIISLSGNSQFTISSQPASSVLPGDTTSFGITFTPTVDGSFTADISIANNDLDESTFTFRVKGTGAERNGLHFDGSNDYVNINSIADDMTGISTWTIESWIKADPSQSGNDHIMAVNTTGTGTIFLFRLDDGFLDFYDGATAFEVGPDLRDNTWHHVAATYNNGQLNLFIDGIAQGAFNAGTINFSSNNRWSLGQEYDGSSKSDYFKGALNEVRIWKTVKTTQQIADARYCEIQNAASDANLTGYYTFNQGVSGGSNTSINTITDASGYANNGTPTSFALTGTTSNFVAATNVGVNCNSVRIALCDIDSYSVPGGNTYTSSGVYIDTLTNSNGGDSIVYTDLSIRFFQITQDNINDTNVCDTIKEFPQTSYTPFARFENADNDWVEINGVVDSLVNTNRSVFLWMREADQVNSHADVLVGINTSGTGTVTNFGINTNEQLWIYDGGNNRNSGVVVTDGQWHFVGYTYDESSNQTQFWVDGVAANSFTNSQSISGTNRISLGQEFDGSSPSNFYDGDMAEVTIWNEVLDATDIALLMESSVQSSHPKYNQLKAYYPMISECNNTDLTLKDFGPHAYHGSMMANDIIITDTLANLPNYNSAPLYNKSWTRNGSQISTSDSLFLTNAIQGGTYGLNLSLDYFNVSDSWMTTVDPTCQGLFASVVIDSNVSCNGLSNGGATVTGINGTAPYTFTWSNGETTTNISNLLAGTYTVTITDGLGDTSSTSISITEPAILNANPIIASNISSAGVSDGIAMATPQGGIPPYTYTWSNGATTPSISGLSAGTFTITVTDAQNCINSGSVTFIAPVSPAPGDIVITEINYNPAESSNDSTEFIEIHNTSSAPVNLLGYKFTSGVVYTFPNISINAGGYLVITGDSVALNNRFGIHAYQWSSGGLSNGGEPIALKDASNNLIDSLRYDDNAPWPTSPDGDGSTLVLCDPNSDNKIGSNWSASSTILSGVIVNSKQVYGSPGVADDVCSGIIASATANSNISCNGLSNGSAVASATGGTTPYTYLWNTGATTASITGIPAGSYSVTVTDNIGSTDSTSVTITEPTILMALALVDSNASCNGLANGGATAAASGGTTPYNYIWSNSATTASITGVSAGTYSVTVTDNNGCTQTNSATITEPSVIDISNVVIQPDCGSSNGNINITPTGGSSPYNYMWSNGSFSEDLSSIPSATYTITITDATGCSKNFNYNVSNAGTLTSSSTTSAASCFASVDGAINITTSGGTTPYNFAWSNGASTGDLSNLGSGIYTLTVSDAIGCLYILSDTIHAPDSIGFVLNQTTISCNGQNDGMIDLTLISGSPMISYNWSNGTTSEDINNLIAGTYTVTVTDNFGCSSTSSTTVTEPATLVTATVVDSNTSCNGFSDGGASASATGGTMPYTYTWSNGATTASITGVIASTYSVTITDQNGCTSTSSATVTEPTALVAATVVDSNASCNGFSDGGTSASASGGAMPYTYAWNNGATTASITGVIASTYSVTIVDANGCSATSSATVTEPTVLVAATVVDSNISCNGFSNGGASTSATGGTAPYTYSWSNSATTASITGVAAGTYTVTVTDVNGCSSTSSATVTEPASLIAASIVDSNTTCNGFSDGGATAFTTGGTAPYTYSWSNAATTASITGIIAGTYTITITDAKGCSNTSSATVTQPTSLIATAVTNNNVSIFGGSDGQVTGSATGGTTPYTYSWNNGATTASTTALSVGTYSITITDQNGCTDSASTNVSQPPAFSASTVVDANVSCNGLAEGEATASPMGGISPFTYNWSNAATTASISGLAAGTYTVTMTDGNSITATSSVTVTQPAVLVAASTVDSNTTCNGLSDGGATAFATGGTAPYTYNWSTSTSSATIATTASITGVTAATYTVTITDNNGCTSTSSATITQPAVLVAASVVDSNITCNGLSDGGATASAFGGTAPYTYAWSTSTSSATIAATTASITGVTAATYSVTVTDNKGCTSTSSATITQPAVLVATSMVDSNTSCNGFADGGASASTTGGTTPYTYAWSTSTSSATIATTASITGVTAATYSMTVTDNKGCTATSSATVTQPAVLVAATVVDSNISCNGFADGGASAAATGGTSSYTYAWSTSTSPATIATTASITGVTAATYSVTVTDNKGCTATSSATVTQPAVLVAATVVDSNVTCNTLSNGGASASATGGTGAYTYAWSTSTSSATIATTASITGITAASYTVTVADANGCTNINTVTITEPAVLVAATVVDSNISCNGFTDGGASASATGGTIPYTYVWSTSASSATTSITGVVAGTYSVTIVDANGCSSISSTTINQPNVIVIATTIDSNVTCNGLANGGVTASALGGTGSYTYEWNNTEITNSITGLSAGNYTITITDVNGCTSSQSTMITEPNILFANITLDSNATCDGQANGGASVNPAGGTTAYNYNWSTGQTSNSINGLSAGSYTVTVTDANSCSSIESIIVSSNNSSHSFIAVDACNSYTVPSGNYTWTMAGIYMDTIPNTVGCDSIITISLTMLSDSIYQTMNICAGDSFSVGSNTYTSTGVYTDLFTNASGCDSIVVTDLTVNSVDVTVSQNGFQLEANNTFGSYQWINCDSNNAVIPNATNRTYRVTVSGNYAVIISEGSCTDTSTCVLVDGLGINDFADNTEINVYPNPTGIDQDIVNIDVTHQTDYDLIIRDLSGKVVYIQQEIYWNSNQIDISGFAAGTFFIEIKTEQFSEYRKLIVM